VEILTSTIKDGPSYLERATFCTADIGADDIILGDPSLMTHEGGHGPLGINTWKMVNTGVTYLIPLMTGGDSNIKSIETVKGTKKIKKIIKDHANHLMRGHLCWVSRGVTPRYLLTVSNSWKRHYRPTCA
jgi:hypothetical protein